MGFLQNNALHCQKRPLQQVVTIKVFFDNLRWYFIKYHQHIRVSIIHFFHINIDSDEKPQIEGFSTTFLSIYCKRTFLLILGGIFLQTISILWFQSFIFFIKLLILMKNPKLIASVPLILRRQSKSRVASNNEQTNNIFQISNLQKFSTMVPNMSCQYEQNSLP